MDLECCCKRALTVIKKDHILLSEQQITAIRSVFSGRDTIVILSTGQGKSIVFEIIPWCYACPGVMVLIVSPLLSLMKKQVTDLRERDLSAVRLSNDLSSDAKSAVERGEFTYIFASFGLERGQTSSQTGAKLSQDEFTHRAALSNLFISSTSIILRRVN